MKNKKNNELAICGLAAVRALSKEHPEKIQRFYFSSSKASQFGDLCKYLAQNKIPYNKVELEDLEKLCGSIHHQGVVAMIEEEILPPLTNSIVMGWIANNESAILLDRVGNANNLGAIVRSAAFFGIKNIILPLNEAQSSITTSSYRVAQGGMEYVNIYSIRSVVRLLQDMEGKMIRIGTDVRAHTTVWDMKKICTKKSVLVVLGNEEYGISSVIKDNCDYLVLIPSAYMIDKEYGGDIDNAPVESLNVAQAASVILYELSKVGHK